MLLQRNKDAVLAVDLAPDAVRLIEVRARKGRPVMNTLAQQTLAEGAPATLPERHLTTLGQLLGVHRLYNRTVIAALPTSMVLTRTINLDKARTPAGVAPGTATIEDQIAWTLENTLPFDPRDLVFDYWPVGIAPGGPVDNKAMLANGEVLVVATQSSVVEKYLKGFERLSLTCTRLDVAPCAMATLLARTAENPDAPVGVIALAKGLGFFAIADRGRVLFWRPFELPAAGLTDGLAAGVLDRMGDEISKCVSHMVGIMQVDTLGEMVVFGHDASDNVTCAYLKNRFHVNVRCPSPFENLPPECLSDALRDSITLPTATHFAVAAGLALQYRTAA